MSKNKKNLTDIMGQKNKSKEPNDGSFISRSEGDSFSMEGTVRYGEEQDSCDE